MGWKLALEVWAVFFAVLGLLSMIRWLLEKLFGSRKICIAIEILTQRDAEAAEVLIRDALFRCLSLPSGNVVILTVGSLREHPELKRVAELYGIACYVIPTEEK